LTLGARLCDRVGVCSLRFAKEAIALAERSERELDLRANVAAMLAWHTGRRTAPTSHDSRGARADACANSASSEHQQLLDGGYMRSEGCGGASMHRHMSKPQSAGA